MIKITGLKLHPKKLIAVAALLLAAGVGTAAYSHSFSSTTAGQLNPSSTVSTKSHKRNKLAVHFRIKKSGEISNVHFDRSSNLSELQERALKNLLETMPAIHSMPKNFPDEVDVVFHFDYKIIKQKAKEA